MDQNDYFTNKFTGARYQIFKNICYVIKRFICLRIDRYIMIMAGRK